MQFMQYLTLGIFRGKSNPKYEKAIDILAEKYAASQIEQPSPSANLLNAEARRIKLKSEFKRNVRLEEQEKQLTNAVAVLLNDGPRHLKDEEWAKLFEELRDAKKKLSNIDYNVSLSGKLYPSLGITDKGIKSIDTVARLKHRFKEYESAISLQILLTTLNSTEPLYWYHLGICLQDAGDNEKAIIAYGFCHILDPDNIATYIFRAECFLKLENKKGAKLECDEAIKLLDPMDNKSPWKKPLEYLLELLGIKKG